MVIVDNCPRCGHPFMYHPTRDSRLISNDRIICQHCYEKENEKPPQLRWTTAKKILVDGYWYVRASDVKIS